MDSSPQGHKEWDTPERPSTHAAEGSADNSGAFLPFGSFELKQVLSRSAMSHSS